MKQSKNIVKKSLTLSQYTYQYKYQKTKLNSYKNVIKTDFLDNELSPGKSSGITHAVITCNNNTLILIQLLNVKATALKYF